MHSIILVNSWAQSALEIAWPIFWQSSLLIAVVLAVDLGFRSKLRANVRYALWLLVLLKLLLPPSLALPSSLAWWIRSPALHALPNHDRAATVRYGSERNDAFEAFTPAAANARPPALSRSAWLFTAWVAACLGLAAWILLRCRQVALESRQAAPAPDWALQLLLKNCRAAGVNASVRLKIPERQQSPCVVGLFLPTILLPNRLLERLTQEQLDSILLHELMHIRRRDAWVNCAQALLQLVYWWHPLLWLANSRIRQVREEAVDDEVMCALGSGSTHYPPTLLEIAKLTVRRPLAGMGILGILEPRGSLRRRIERLIDFRPPARAGWGLGSTIVILAFGAVALPMGQKQKAGEDLDVPAANPEFRSLAEASSPAVLSATSNGVHLEFGRNRLSADQVTLAVSNRQPILTASGHVVAEQNQVPETLGSGGKFTTFGYDIATVVAPPPAGQKETLESANQQKAAAAVQILINARFVLAPLELSDSLWTLVGRTNQAGRDEATGDFWALLTPAQAAVLRRRVESTSESQLIISAASVVSLSGRQTEIQITDLKNIVTNLNPQALIPPGISSTNELYQSGNMALGPILDSVASVLADGFHIQVEARANVSEFIGYDDPQRKVQAYVDGKRTSVVQPLPHFREGKAVASAAVPDGHTLLLGTTMHDNFGAAVVTSKAKNDHLLVLLTITLIDSAGNRLHPDQ